MASFRKRGAKYEVSWRDPDAAQRSKNVPNLTAAKKLKREVEEVVSRGFRWEPQDAAPRPQLPVVFQAFLREKKNELRPRTLTRYGQNLDVFVRFLRETRGAQTALYPGLLSKHMLREFHEWAGQGTGRHGRDRNLDTRAKLVETARLAWEWAYDDDFYGEFFTEGRAPPRRLRFRREPGKSAVAPSWAQMAACVRAARGWHQRVAIVLYYTGLRPSQVMGLQWEDFDLNRNLLFFRGTLGKSPHERRGRTLAISPYLSAEIATWGCRKGWLIESGRSSRGPRDRTFRAREMNRAWARAGVEERVWKGQPCKAFRKGLTSNLKREGADSEAVEHLVGHQSPGIRDHYLDAEYLPNRGAVDFIPNVWEVVAEDEKVADLDQARARAGAAG